MSNRLSAAKITGILSCAGFLYCLLFLSCGHTSQTATITVDAGLDQTIHERTIQLHGKVSNLQALNFWTADGDHDHENMLVHYDSNSGVSYAGPLKGRGKTLFGWPGDFQRVGNLIYGVDLYHRRLYQLNISTGKCAPMKSRLAYKRVTGLAYDGTNDRLYGVDQATRTLLLLNRETGEGSPVLTLPPSQSDVRGLAYNPSDKLLYYSDEATESVYRLDVQKGESGLVLTIFNGPDANLEELDFYNGRLLGSLAIFRKEKDLWSMQLIEIHTGKETGWEKVGPEIADVSPHCLLIDSLPERVYWRQKAGPGDSIFSNRFSPETEITFPTSGAYTLELVAETDTNPATDSVEITVLPM